MKKGQGRQGNVGEVEEKGDKQGRDRCYWLLTLESGLLTNKLFQRCDRWSNIKDV